MAKAAKKAFGGYHISFKGCKDSLESVFGSGKTALMTFLLSQVLRTGARVIYFDKDRGADLFVRAVGGRYSVIRQGLATDFNPLRLPDSAPIVW